MSGKALLKTKDDKDATKGKTSHLSFCLNLFSFPCIDTINLVYDSAKRAHDLVMQTVTIMARCQASHGKSLKIDSLGGSSHRSIRHLQRVTSHETIYIWRLTL